MLAELVAAIRRGDLEAMDALRSHRPALVAEAQGLTEEAERGLQLSPAEHAALVLWLNTPTDAHAAAAGTAADDTEPRTPAGRLHGAQIDALFSALADPALARRVAAALRARGYERVDDWIGVGHEAAASARDLCPALVPEQRARIAGGYAAAVTGLVAGALDDPHQATVSLEPGASDFLLVIRGDVPVDSGFVARAIADWSGAPPATALVLARAISFALPAQPECLPGIEFLVGSRSCYVRSLLVNEFLAG